MSPLFRAENRAALSSVYLVRIFPSGAVEINRQSLLDIIEPLLRAEARRALEGDLPATPFVSFEQVAATGITLRYDASRLEIVIERIEPSLRETQLLGFATASEVSITSQPERFSTSMGATRHLALSIAAGLPTG